VPVPWCPYYHCNYSFEDQNLKLSHCPLVDIRCRRVLLGGLAMLQSIFSSAEHLTQQHLIHSGFTCPHLLQTLRFSAELTVILSSSMSEVVARMDGSDFITGGVGEVNPVLSWVRSQSGLLRDKPQLQRDASSLPSTITKYGPFSWRLTTILVM
jgi:hypothetical protein